MEYPTVAQAALAAELESNGESLRKQLSPDVHRTQLWRFATGQRRPDIKAAVAIERATEGRVPVEGWLLDGELSVEAALSSHGDALQSTGTDG